MENSRNRRGALRIKSPQARTSVAPSKSHTSVTSPEHGCGRGSENGSKPPLADVAAGVALLVGIGVVGAAVLYPVEAAAVLRLLGWGRKRMEAAGEKVRPGSRVVPFTVLDGGAL